MTVQNIGDFETGLEDFDMSDAVIPRLTIVHKEGQFKDGLSGEQFPNLQVIILGLVKQRVLWHTTVDDDDRPMCRSTNHDLGFPNMRDEQPKEKRFPWDKSGFDPADYPADANGVIRVPCDGCQLKEWKSHPDGKKPYCSEQYTLPVLFKADGPIDDWTDYTPAIITFQKTALKGLKAYLSSFARSRNAAYTVVTEFGLDMLKRGQTDYSVPNFKKVGETPEEMWREFATSYRTIREFLQAEPGSRDDDEDGTPAPSDNTAKPPAAAAPKKEEPKVEEPVEAEIVPQPEASGAPAAASAADDEDDLPF